MRLRSFAAFLFDLAAAAVAWCVAYWLRFNFDIPSFFLDGMLQLLLPAVLLQGGSFTLFGLYRTMWRHASVQDLQRIVLAAGVAALAIPTVVLLLEQRGLVPRSVYLLDPMLLVLLTCGARLGFRAWKEHRLYGRTLMRGEPVVVIGAGEAGAALVRGLQRSESFRVVALFDDDEKIAGRRLHGVRVAGPISALRDFARRGQVKRAIVAMPSSSSATRRRAVETAQQAGLSVLTVPAFEDLVSGRVAISQIRNVELEDLLGRDQVELDMAGIGRLIGEQTVVVTGAGGSIGSELCRQLARHRPTMIVLYEANEFALYKITEEFAAHHPGCTVVPVIGDIKDDERVRATLSRYRPAVLFHAAAYKHVPLMEGENAWQAVRNNVAGTAIVAAAARDCGVSKFVLISTDKAVNPTNVMGATKRLAEMICQSVAVEQPAACRFVVVRFGNVLGSAGSVIPKFAEQIRAGGPVTVTHPDIERYFMSIPEAAQLVLQAALMGEGGEIFVLDMGEPIKIADLARDMVRLSGFSQEEIRIVFTGLRPGEKMFEELLADDEQTLRTRHPKIRVARPRTAPERGWRERLLSEIGASARADVQGNAAYDAGQVRRWLSRWVLEYRPTNGETTAMTPAADSTPTEGDRSAVTSVAGYLP